MVFKLIPAPTAMALSLSMYWSSLRLEASFSTPSSLPSFNLLLLFTRSRSMFLNVLDFLSSERSWFLCDLSDGGESAEEAAIEFGVVRTDVKVTPAGS